LKFPATFSKDQQLLGIFSSFSESSAEEVCVQQLFQKISYFFEIAAGLLNFQQLF